MRILLDLDDSPTGALHDHHHLLPVLDPDYPISTPAGAPTRSDLPGDHLGYDALPGLSDAVKACKTRLEGAQQVLTQVVHLRHPLA